MKQTSVISTLSPSTTATEALVNIGDWFVHTLAAIGIEQSFGYPGAAIEPLYNALSRAKKYCNAPIDILTMKHESSAVYAAEGYYRVTQKIPICLATAGPGASNFAAGLSSALVERTPMLVITGNIAAQDFGRGVFQDSSAASDDFDSVALLGQVCRYSVLITHPLQLPHVLYKALSIITSNSPGPVHLSISLNVLKIPLSELKQTFPSPAYYGTSLPQFSQGLNEATMQKILDMLLPPQILQKTQKRRVVSPVCLVIGGNCKTIAKDLMRIAQQLAWKIIATPTGKGLINHDHPYFRGVIGFGGHALAYETLNATNQKVIIIGTRFDESETGGWFAGSLRYEDTIQIDTAPDHFFCYVPAKIRYVCDLELFTQRLEQALFPHAPITLQITHHTDPDGRPCYVTQKHWEIMQSPEPIENDGSIATKRIKPQVFIKKLNELAAPNAHICSDSGSSFMWTTHLFWPSMQRANTKNPNNFHVAMGLSMMGWSPGASIGAAQALKAANDNTPCICIVGDGGYLMSSQEIATATQCNLNIAFFIINNKSLGIVEHCQKILGAEPIAYELPEVDFAKSAEAFNIPSFRIQSSQALENGWNIFMNTLGPALFDVIVDHDELPPLGFRLEVLGFQGKKKD